MRTAGVATVIHGGGCAWQEILSLVTAKFARFVQHMTVQVDKDPPLDWLLPPEGSTHHDGEHNGHEASHPPSTP